jgi:hypothetical protein
VARPEVVRNDSGWRLPLAGRMVSGLMIDDAVTLRCVDATSTLLLQLDGPFTVHTPSGEDVEVVPDAGPAELAGALSLLFRAIADADVNLEGRLVVRFGDGGSLSLQAEELFHSWRLHDGEALLMASMPENYTAVARPR